jgi:fumarate hydratase subunit alpha
MRKINTNQIGAAVQDALMEISFFLPDDVKKKLRDQSENETSVIGKSILNKIMENSRISESEKIPLCQDTGMVVIFMEIGQEIVLEGSYIEDVINGAVEKAYREGYLRKSTVSPLGRVNRKDNTPAVVHYQIVPGDKIKLIIGVKGFGSENMSQMKMLKPSDGLEGVMQFVIDTVVQGGPNPCPPIVVGVGIGGTMEKAAWMAKHALMREIGSDNPDAQANGIEKELLKKVNELNIGPMGLGGDTTALGVFVEMYPTHIAGLPVVVNINCHSSRHKEVIL